MHCLSLYKNDKSYVARASIDLNAADEDSDKTCLGGFLECSGVIDNELVSIPSDGNREAHSWKQLWNVPEVRRRMTRSSRDARFGAQLRETRYLVLFHWTKRKTRRISRRRIAMEKRRFSKQDTRTRKHTQRYTRTRIVREHTEGNTCDLHTHTDGTCKHTHTLDNDRHTKNTRCGTRVQFTTKKRQGHCFTNFL